MIDYPKTLEEAQKIFYAHSSSRNISWETPKGTRYSVFYCAFDVNGHQCTRYNGYGIGHLYCKQHAEIVERMMKK